MAKIYSPNEQYSGVSASVAFINGQGETDDPRLIRWFKEHGYKVVEEMEDEASEVDAEETEEEAAESEEADLESMTVDELKAYAEENGIDIGRASSQEGILKKIQE